MNAFGLILRSCCSLFCQGTRAPIGSYFVDAMLRIDEEMLRILRSFTGCFHSCDKTYHYVLFLFMSRIDLIMSNSHFNAHEHCSQTCHKKRHSSVRGTSTVFDCLSFQTRPLLRTRLPNGY
ncbi:hypothetical protein VCUG_01698 [Vavraia culicis subsp. floridensis]|uniref:Uncharacterized protein n=1 Tax=Vavraia culicis (isolate floridensis) TaxID=948595 RepID=L2GU25_VAVCU|nr:uncharacterized protein VCUG_01698 [Vavraia culicis subsp. floridensis]ELA46798.1 hypothetical protein VCUG_01698 [Vavraia culicis subsp. floridensis]